MLNPANLRGGVGFTDGGDKDGAEGEVSTFRRRSQMVKDGSQPEPSELGPVRRNSGHGKAHGDKNKDEGGARDRRRSVRTNGGTGHHSSNNTSSGAALKKKHDASHHSQSGNASFGKVMDQSAKRINAAVHSLYRAVPKKVEEPSGKNSKKRGARESSHDNKDGHASEANQAVGGRRGSLLVNDELQVTAKPESSSDSDTSDSEHERQHDQQNEDLSEESGSDDYDFKQAALKVNTLLDSLNSETRTNIMSDLNNWYTSRKQGVEEDLAELNNVDTEHQLREEETKTSMASMLQSFEDKQMREVKVLVKCNRTLNLGARRKLTRRTRFAKKKQAKMEEMEETLKELKGRKPGPRTSKSKRKSSKKDGEGGKRKSTSRKSELDDVGGTWETADSDQEQSGSEASDDDDEEGSEEDSEQGAENRQSTMDSPESQQGGADPDMPETLEDGLDIEAARKKLKEMHDVPQRVMAQMNSEEAPASDILQALATVQEGQLNLEVRAKLARKACDISKAAVDHITEGRDEEDADEAVRALIEEVRVQVSGENGDGLAAGPDPEELEEECRALEALIAKQEKDIEAYNKVRERSLRLEQDMADHLKEADSDDGGDDGHHQPTLLKSELRDGRLEAAQNQRNNVTARGSDVPKAKATLNRVRNAIKMTRSKTKEVEGEGGGGGASGGNSTAGASGMVQTLSNAGPTLPSWQSNRQIQLLQEKISEKEAKIAKAKDVHKRMKKELSLLRYCAQKSEAGLDALLEEFDPSKVEAESDSSSDDSDHARERFSSNNSAGSRGQSSAGSSNRKSTLAVPGGGSHDSDPRQKGPRGSVVVSAAVPGSGGSSSKDAKRHSKRNTAKRGSNMAAPEARGGKLPSDDGGGRQRHKGFDEKFTKEVQAFNSKKLEEAEAEMKARISELQVQITRDVYNLKSEKKRQNILKKDIKRLKKSYQNMVKKHKGAPSSLEALDNQMTTLQTGETKLKTQIKELNEELNRQQRMLERAQAEADDNEQKRKAANPPGSAEAASGGILAGGIGAGGLLGSLNSTIGMTSSAPAAAPAAAAAGEATTAAVAGTAPTAAMATPSGAAAAISTTGAGTSVGTANALGLTGQASASQMSRQVSESSSAGHAASSRAHSASGSSATAAEGEASSSTFSPSVSVTASIATGALLDPVAMPRDPTVAAGDPVAAPGLSPRGSAVGAAAGPRSSVARLIDAGASPAAANAAAKVTPEKPSPPVAKTEEKPTTGGVGHEDLAELVRLQSRNEEFKQEIEETMKKMQQLRLAMKKGKAVSSDAIREIVGGTMNPEDTKPPPEYFALKKEVRVKQNEVRGLRKRWWTDHKDLDALVEKVRHTHGIHEHHGGAGAHFAHSKSFSDAHGHEMGGHPDGARPDIEPLRRNLIQAQHDHHRSSMIHHSSGAFFGNPGADHDDEALTVGHAPGHHPSQSSHPGHQGGHRHSVKPLALGSLAAFRPVEAGSSSRYRLSSELASYSHHEPLSPPSGITGKTFARSSIKNPDAESEQLSAIRKRYSQVRKSLVPEAAHSISELVSGESIGKT